ncbi:hypothetical protein GCM10009619_35800 [Williamsia maris]
MGDGSLYAARAAHAAVGEGRSRHRTAGEPVWVRRPLWFEPSGWDLLEHLAALCLEVRDGLVLLGMGLALELHVALLLFG